MGVSVVSFKVTKHTEYKGDKITTITHVKPTGIIASAAAVMGIIDPKDDDEPWDWLQKTAPQEPQTIEELRAENKRLHGLLQSMSKILQEGGY